MMNIFLSMSLLKLGKNMTIMTLTSMLMMTLVKMSDPNMPMIQSIMNDNLTNTLIMLSMTTTLLIILLTKSTQLSNLTTLIMVSLMMTFSMTNVLFFYITFELTMIPTFMMIMYNGTQPERKQASVYLLLYTVMASLPLLIIILTKMPAPMNFMSMYTINTMINNSLMMILAFMVKSPMFTLHLWLPKAHVEAPMEGSMVLAAILLKMGTYGLIRTIPFISHNMKQMNPWIMSIALIGSITTNLMCLRNKDLKAIIAYSSVSHMSLSVMAIMSMNQTGQTSAIMIMVAHGLTSSSMFMMATLTYKSSHSRNTLMFKGMINLAPNMAMWWFIIMMANMATPPFINIMSEILMLTAIMQWATSPMTMSLITLSSMTMAAFCILLFSTISHSTTSQKTKTSTMTTKHHTIMMTHIAPLILLIMYPELMTLH